MLDVKEAARRASEYFAGLYSDEKIDNVQLEEVEFSDDENVWLITLSYPVFPLEISPRQFLGKRKYKLFTIDAETGQVKSMKMRNVE